MVLRRLKSKEEEWRDAQRGFNKIWREQNEKYYLKSLDHQGANFKQNDIKNIKNKTLINEIEALYDERLEVEDTLSRPHLLVSYPDDLTVMEDGASLIIHHVKRQAYISIDDKHAIKQLVLRHLPDILHYPRSAGSDDDDRQLPKEADSNYHEVNMLTVNTTWYCFFRLHHLLCERLGRIKRLSECVLNEHKKEVKGESTALALRLRRTCDIPIDQYYVCLLDQVKSLLDGNIECMAYEDLLREMFGVNAYIVFTMDKLIQNCVRQLHSLICEDLSVECLEEWLAYTKESGDQRELDSAYQKKMEQLLNDDSCFKITIEVDYKMGLEMLDNGIDDEAETLVDIIERHADYAASMASVTRHISTELAESILKWPVFIPRIEVDENTECRFDFSSYKMIYVVNTGDSIYRKQSLTRAKMINPILHLKQHNSFQQFCNGWLLKNVSKDDELSINDWLSGNDLDTVTFKVTIKTEAGFYINKYSVS